MGDLRRQELTELFNSPWSSVVVLIRSPQQPYHQGLVPTATNRRHAGRSGGRQVVFNPEYKVSISQSRNSGEGQGENNILLWQFKVMPIGMCNVPATYDRLMVRVLEGLHWKAALIYLDDRTVLGQTFKMKLERLSEVSARFRTVHLTLSPKKCCLFQKEVQYLGRTVGKVKVVVRADPEKVAELKDLMAPTNMKGFLSCAHNTVNLSRASLRLLLHCIS